MNRQFLFWLALCLPALCCAQNFQDYIRANAIVLSDTPESDSTLYQLIREKKLIMLGEMHGTNEPARFAYTIARCILKYEGQVKMGLEIPEREMAGFIAAPSRESLLKSAFFQKENNYGMNGQAWFDLLVACMETPGIRLFFFDNHNNKVEWRDSIMYISLRKEVIKDPNTKIITLSGNVHNRLTDFRGKHVFGSYCVQDQELFPANSIVAFNHLYAGGTMMNNRGDGLRVYEAQNNAGPFSVATELEQYGLLLPSSGEDQPHNAVFYTRTVTHSPSLDHTH